jgi:ABC-type nitrate/sulfonate/bicarbonate transport system substrate-binding protein
MDIVSTHRPRPVWFAPLLILSVAMVLAGCSTAASPEAAPVKAPTHKGAHKLTPVYVQLNWLTNVEFSGLWVADHLGWFRKAGLVLKAHPWSNGINPEEVTSSCWAGHNGYCIGFDDSAAVAIARAAGNDVKAIWVGSQKTPFGFITCKVTGNPKIDSRCKSRMHKNITSPRQWKGLRIGYQSHELYVPEVMLGSVGLSLKDVVPVVVQFDTSVLTNGTVDAYLVFINNEPISLELKGVRVNVIPAYKYGMGAFYADTMFAPDSEIKAHPAFIRTFVHLVDKGWKYALAHWKSTADMIVKYYFKSEFGAPVNRRQQELELKKFATTLARDPSGHWSGCMTLARWKQIVHILTTYPADLSGKPVISHPINARDAFTNAFC